MNSIIEVSKNIIAFIGSERPSEFRMEKLRQASSLKNPTRLECFEIYFCLLNIPYSSIDKKEIKSLSSLLHGGEDRSFLDKHHFFVTPRIGTISPWSSKATEIIKICGFNHVDRVERAICYFFKESANPEEIKLAGTMLADKMTQEVIGDLANTSKLFSNLEPARVKDINISSDFKEGLVNANHELGLALNKEEINYLFENYVKSNKNPTDAELMMFAQANSEHCRHKIFNADWTIDGAPKKRSLFDMIRNTYENHSDGVISAYEDNAAILEGNTADRFYPLEGLYKNHNEDVNLVIKVETHNHPTAISPFSGASTGSGGEIRDEGATGIGAKPKAGLTGFSVSNLRIPSLREKWEFEEDKPDRIASPLQIMIDAPIGAASFNNEFGRPNILGYFRAYESKKREEHYGYHKPIMLAGGLGNIKTEHAFKKDVPVGSKLIVLGGPAMLIGLGGGSASSLSSGEGDKDLDFASVQRENPEMERRCQEVLDRCWQDKSNPILFIHDVGAGGLSNAVPELVKDSGHGGLVNLRDIPNSEPGMSPMEIWCNESQERYVLAISENDLVRFSGFCERERCPYSVIGEITSGRNLEVYDSHFDNYPISISLETLFGKPPKTHLTFNRKEEETSVIEFSDELSATKIFEVLRHPSVASKGFLITIGDRTVTGLIKRDQMVGPWQVPVSDYGLCMSGFSSSSGEAMAVGERSPLSLINSKSAARISVAEVVTNIVSSGISNISDIKLSANWMGSPGKLDGSKDLYDAVESIGMELCPQWNITIPVGKDSLSMTTEWIQEGKQKSTISPLSLIVSGFAPVKDISIAVTPELKNKESCLIFIDLAKGKQRMGGSIFSQTYCETDGYCPDVECEVEMPLFVKAINKLLSLKKILAYHDRSDGGLVTTLAEMSFAGRLGLSINLNDVLKEGKKLTELLLNEELGAVIQVPSEEKEYVIDILNESGLEGHIYDIGSISKESKIDFVYENKNLLSLDIKDMLENWHRVGHEIQLLRDNPETASCEYKNYTDIGQQGLSPEINFLIPKKISIESDNPRIAILREQGVNGQNEMAAAFQEVGFECIDVHMTDLVSKRHLLKDFEGLVACGGFSYGDVLGAGGGWANSVLFNKDLRDQFGDFFHDDRVFSLGVCNGCQTLALLSTLIPGAEQWPSFKRNLSEKFEARLIQVSVNKSPSIFFKDMEGSRIPVPVAHGEGRVDVNAELLKNSLTSITYSNSNDHQTESYPDNPNGSYKGIAGLTNESGTVTIMMPHPERAFLKNQLSWSPDEWTHYSPWIKFFQNARKFIN